jgi:hypothetical protein
VHTNDIFDFVEGLFKKISTYMYCTEVRIVFIYDNNNLRFCPSAN